MTRIFDGNRRIGIDKPPDGCIIEGLQDIDLDLEKIFDATEDMPEMPSTVRNENTEV